MHHFNAWHLNFFPDTFNCLFSKTNMLKIRIFRRLPSLMAELKKPQPPILASALAVARENCREPRKLIGMLTQDTSHEKLVKPSEAWYCCREHNRPCLRNISTRGMPIYKHNFGESPRSSSTL